MVILEDTRIEKFDNIVKMTKESREALIDYWLDFSLYTSFEYWMMVSILVVPLIFLFFKIDKSKIFLIGFYGYSIHMTFAYIDLFGKNKGFWNYPFPVIPYIPGISIDSSFIPVTCMLVYQWTLNRNKNYYIYAIVTAACLSFLFKPFLVSMGLFRMYGNISYIHLFLGYLSVQLIAKFITNVFIWIQKRYNKTSFNQ